MTMTHEPFHRKVGWVGTVIALADYGAFAAGWIPEMWFFTLGVIASLFLTWALFRDHVGYGVLLQGAFILLNVIGMVRVIWG